MSDLNFQNFSTVQSEQQPTPASIVAATTVAPTTFLTVLLGTTNVATITPPVSGCHMLALVYETTAGSFLTSGNIVVGSTTVVSGVPCLFIYNPLTAKYSLVRGTAA